MYKRTTSCDQIVKSLISLKLSCGGSIAHCGSLWCPLSLTVISVSLSVLNSDDDNGDDSDG